MSTRKMDQQVPQISVTLDTFAVRQKNENYTLEDSH